jgi:hypothetical protein
MKPNVRSMMPFALSETSFVITVLSTVAVLLKSAVRLLSLRLLMRFPPLNNTPCVALLMLWMLLLWLWLRTRACRLLRRLLKSRPNKPPLATLASVLTACMLAPTVSHIGICEHLIVYAYSYICGQQI